MNLGNGEKIGVLGGGQLGLMLMEAAEKFNIELFFLDPDPDAPCSKFTERFTLGDFKNKEDVLAFSKGKDIMTIEIENVNTEALKQISDGGTSVFPSPELIDTVKDKGLQKEFYRKNAIPTSPFIICKDAEEFKAGVTEFPVVQKLRTGGYDGKGVQVFKSEADFENAFSAPSILEKHIPFEQEISVIVSRNEKGDIRTFPTVGMEFNEEANLVEFLFSPAKVTKEIEEQAQEIGKKTAQAYELVGIMAVEMFVTKEGHVLVNEVAPRPHNSGHQSIEGNVTSQYAQHLRAILGLELGDTSITKPSVMVNLLGAKGHIGDATYHGIEEFEGDKEVFVHLYGKKKTKPFRKMGHVTVLSDSISLAIEKANKVNADILCLSA